MLDTFGWFLVGILLGVLILLVTTFLITAYKRTKEAIRMFRTGIYVPPEFRKEQSNE
jgi:cell division protein FtsW (lipid II flippase)